MGEVVEHLIECGHNLEDILHKYTIDQVWLFYEKSVVIRRKKQHEDAMLLAHVVTLPYSKDASKAFMKYVNSLLPKELRQALRREKKRSVQEHADPRKAFQALGLPIKGKGPPPGARKKPKKPTRPEKRPIPKIDDEATS